MVAAGGVRRLLLLGLGWWLAAGCSTPPPVPPPTVTVASAETLTIGLTGSAADLAGLITFAPPATSVRYVTNNSEALFADLAAGRVDALLAHHLPTGGERAEPYWFNPVALDGVVIIVHPDNPVTALTRGEIQAIFSGRFTNWSQVGGPDAPIAAVVRERGAGTRAVFNQRIMAEQRVTINAVVQPTNEAVITHVAAQPGAIGYTMLGAIPRASADLSRFVRMVAVDGIAPGPLTTADQSYPLTVPLYFVDSAEPTGPARALLAWLQSGDGQAALGVRYGRVR